MSIVDWLNSNLEHKFASWKSILAALVVLISMASTAIYQWTTALEENVSASTYIVQFTNFPCSNHHDLLLFHHILLSFIRERLIESSLFMNLICGRLVGNIWRITRYASSLIIQWALVLNVPQCSISADSVRLVCKLILLRCWWSATTLL